MDNNENKEIQNSEGNNNQCQNSVLLIGELSKTFVLKRNRYIGEITVYGRNGFSRPEAFRVHFSTKVLTDPERYHKDNLVVVRGSISFSVSNKDGERTVESIIWGSMIDHTQRTDGNSVRLKGYVVSQPEIYVGIGGSLNGTYRSNLRIICARPGQNEKDVKAIPCTFENDLAKTIAGKSSAYYPEQRPIKAGDFISVMGYLHIRNNAVSGIKTYEVLGESFEYLGYNRIEERENNPTIFVKLDHNGNIPDLRKRKTMKKTNETESSLDSYLSEVMASELD